MMTQFVGASWRVTPVLVILSYSALISAAMNVPMDRLLGERPQSLRRRYWGDDTGLCLKKYCLQYTGTTQYIDCLKEFCQMGLLITPRELQAPGASWHLGDKLDMEDQEAYGHGGSQNYDVDGKNELERGFQGLSGLSSLCAGDSGTYAEEPCTSPTCVLKEVMYGPSNNGANGRMSETQLLLCTAMQCSNAPDVLQCFREVCCGTKSSHANITSKKRSTETSENPLARKRRVNDEVSQCIQSYCSSKSGYHDRLLCIVNKCNRG